MEKIFPQFNKRNCPYLNLELMNFFPYLNSFPSVECNVSVCKKKWTHLFEQGCYVVLLNVYMWVRKIILFCYVLNSLVDVFYFSPVLYNATDLLNPTLNSSVFYIIKLLLRLGEGKDQRNRKTV